MHRRTFLKLAGSTSSRIELALAAVFAACALAPGALADEPVALREADLMGIWKMCYEPGIPGVYEPSSGYLVLMPDGRYYEIREDCCPSPDDPPNLGGVNTSR